MPETKPTKAVIKSGTKVKEEEKQNQVADTINHNAIHPATFAERQRHAIDIIKAQRKSSAKTK